MKLGIIADIHGNLPALEAVLAALAAEGCVKVLCLGDITGYGPFPNECVGCIQKGRIPTVLGNHDDWATHEQVVLGVSGNVAQALAWTRRQLSGATKAWLRELPKALSVAGVHLVHASNRQGRNVWPYVRDVRRLEQNFERQEHRLCFNGHTHSPAVGICFEDGSVEFMTLAEVVTPPPTARVLINPGSVGQPRDGDPRAAAAIFETRDLSVRFLRVEYDIAATQAAIMERGLPARFAERLADGH